MYSLTWWWDIRVRGRRRRPARPRNLMATIYYPSPKEKAKNIKKKRQKEKNLLIVALFSVRSSNLCISVKIENRFESKKSHECGNVILLEKEANI